MYYNFNKFYFFCKTNNMGVKYSKMFLFFLPSSDNKTSKLQKFRNIHTNLKGIR